jgi:hypothetical protein
MTGGAGQTRTPLGVCGLVGCYKSTGGRTPQWGVQKNFWDDDVHIENCDIHGAVKLMVLRVEHTIVTPACLYKRTAILHSIKYPSR